VPKIRHLDGGKVAEERRSRHPEIRRNVLDIHFLRGARGQQPQEARQLVNLTEP